jgi:hypothetical protein
MWNALTGENGVLARTASGMRVNFKLGGDLSNSSPEKKLQQG